MQVFISWSGDRSRAVSELLDEWIQCVLQAICPWMSSKDIDRGSLWFSEISDQLKDTKIGIVCLTKDNLNSPWILFEAGALATGISSVRVCTFLVDLEPTDVGNPLAQFNHTMPDKDGLFELVRTLNSALGEKSLREKVLEQVFETYWPKFESEFKSILKDNEAGEHEPVRSEESLSSEILRTVRSLNRRIRSIEASFDDGHRTKSSFSKRKPPMWVRREIDDLIEQGLPEKIIEELMEGTAPASFIQAHLARRQKSKLLEPVLIEDDPSMP